MQFKYDLANVMHMNGWSVRVAERVGRIVGFSGNVVINQ